MFLSRLAQWSGHDAVLSTLVGFKTVQLTRVAGSATEFIEFEPGHPQPAHAMADGKLLMSYMPVEQRRWLYEAEPLRMFTPNTITDPEAIEREFVAIQERGYAVDNYERFAVGRGIAAPVMDTEGRPIAAMLCLGKIDPAQDEEIVQQMLALTREMSERLKGAGDLPASALDLAEPDEEAL
nr:IclR family transcriptional regulator C-terminal domain-containing protein [Aeromicrobium wangtongii]